MNITNQGLHATGRDQPSRPSDSSIWDASSMALPLLHTIILLDYYIYIYIYIYRYEYK